MSASHNMMMNQSSLSMGTDYQCAPDDYQLFQPVCPGNDVYSYCDGGYDCIIINDNTGDLCDCEAGQKYCTDEFNLCDHTTSADQICHFYIEYDSYLPFENAKRMSCEKSNLEQDMSYSYFWSSCCSNDGYFTTSVYSGGFELRGGFQVNDQICKDYSWEMSTLLCSPDQGKYIENNSLRVCLSSCQTLFDACGLPGVNFPSDTEYTDAMSLCYAAWGGFYNDSPCIDLNQKVHYVGMVYLIWKWWRGKIVLVFPKSYHRIIWMMFVAATVVVLVGRQHGSICLQNCSCVYWLEWTILLCKLKRIQNSKENSSGGQDTVQGPNGASGTNAVESIPFTSALVEVPVANAIPTPIVTTVQEPATNAGQPSAPPPDKDLTFDQTMDLQSLKFKLKMDAITQAEFEVMKKEILYR